MKKLQEHFTLIQGEGKGKAHPRTGHKASTLSLTWALDGGGWSTPHPGEKEPVPIV